MSQNIGTLISAAIRPNDSLDPIASAFGNEIKGGLHSYTDINERNAIIVERRQFGMLVYVTNNGKTYQLSQGNGNLMDNTNWVEFNSGAVALPPTKEWVDSVKDILIVEPVLTPTTNDRYLLGLTSSLVLTGTKWGYNPYTSTQIVEWNTTSLDWTFITPTNGMTVRVDSDNSVIHKYNGSYPSGTWIIEKISQVYYIEPTTSNGFSYVINTDPLFTSLSKDLIFLTKFATTNSGVASLNINGIGSKIVKKVGAFGLENLHSNEILVGVLYSISYNGTYFQLTNAFPNSYNIQFFIPAGETVTVKENEQYWVYKDLTIEGTLNNYGQVIVVSGDVVLQQDGVLNLLGNPQGEVIMVDLSSSIIGNASSNNTGLLSSTDWNRFNNSSSYWTLIGNTLTANNIGNVTGPGFVLGDAANQYLRLFRNQNDFRIVLGNHDASQATELISTNLLSTNLVSSGDIAFRVKNGLVTQATFSVPTDKPTGSYVIATKQDLVPNVQTVTSNATVTPVSTSDLVRITAQAVGLTLANPTGTFQEGQSLMIRIKDNGAARTITYGSSYRALGINLPTTTVALKTMYLGIIFNQSENFFDVIGISQQA